MVGSIMVMIHAPNWREGLDWYQRAFPEAVRRQEPNEEFEYLTIGNITLEVVQADEKVPCGAAGSVVYWYTEDFDERLAFLLSLGATHFRGPMDLCHGIRMCQVLDPFGNPLGIRTQLIR